MNAKEIAQRFIDGRPGRTQNFWTDGTHVFSYRTEVARWTFGGKIAVSTVKYSQSTSRQVSHLIHALASAGYTQTEDAITVNVTNPGRHGGRGFAWGPQWSDVPFTVWEKPDA